MLLYPLSVTRGLSSMSQSSGCSCAPLSVAGGSSPMSQVRRSLVGLASFRTTDPPCLLSDARTVKSRTFPNPCIRVHEQSPHLQWQLVKERFWGRKLRKLQSCSRPTKDSRSQICFKEKMRGKCYNCLGKGHFKASCRGPPKCWVCTRSGHISTSCPLKAY
jgi:hypothetical protein